jgi:hypothetical protein
MGGRGHAAAFIGLLMLLQVVAMDRQAACATPDSARDLQARREALRTWTARGKQPGQGLELWLRRRVGATYPTYTAAHRSRTSFSELDFNITLYVDGTIAAGEVACSTAPSLHCSMSSHAHVMTGCDLMSVCCLVIALFVGALASPHRGREEEPARPAAMQDRFRTASQQAVDVCRRQQRQQPSQNTGMQSQQPEGSSQGKDSSFG